MSQNLQNFAKFQKFQLDNLVDFEKCCKTHIFLQKSVPIQPKTSNILPKICQKIGQKLEEKLENIGADHAVVLEPDGDVERRRLAVEHAVVAVVAPAAALAEERLARRDGFLRGAAAPRPRPDLDEPTCKKKHNPLY